jgi:hypothetical protein
MATLKLVMYAMFGVGFQGEAPNREVIFDLHQSGPFLKTHFAALNLVSEWAGLPEEEIFRISNTVSRLIGMPEKTTTPTVR